jgi:CHAD domain-containing protein
LRARRHRGRLPDRDGSGRLNVAAEFAEARLDPAEPALAGLLRVLGVEIAAARADLARLGRRASPELVHQVRKRLKKARSILRVVKPTLGAEAAPLGSFLREAAHRLAGQRDATVLASTAKTLARKLGKGRGRRILREIAEAADRRDDAGADATQVGHAAAALAEAAARLATVEVRDEAVFAARLARVYGKARAGFRAARKSPDAETLHEWRKRVKDRLHMARLFDGRWPEPAKPRPKKLDRLGEWLGDDHDLAMLADALPAKGAKKLRRAIGARRKRLAEKSFDLATELFATRPAKVRDAWRAGLR